MAVPMQLRLDPGDHVVHFYERDDGLSAMVGAHLGEGLRAGDAAVVLATADHRAGFERSMAAEGVDVAAARAAGRLVELDAADVLARLAPDGALDPTAFETIVGAVVRRAGARGRRVQAYGELVALLWDAGHVGAAIELEDLWNGLGAELPFSLFCAYPAAIVSGDEHADALAHTCALHSAVVDGAGGLDPEARRRFPCTPGSPRAARRFVAATLRGWGREDLVGDAMLVSAELAANAVLHARSRFEVVLTRRHDGAVRIAVRDASAARPVPRAPAAATSSGRGLVLVGALASRWGHEPLEDGKQVWAELAC